MPDIPLRSLRPNRAAYAPLSNSDDHHDHHDHDQDMHTGVMAASSAARRNAKGKRRAGFYADEPEEEEQRTLLGGAGEDEEEVERDGERERFRRRDVEEGRRAEASSRVCPVALGRASFD
jgi:hypothetical protein